MTEAEFWRAAWSAEDGLRLGPTNTDPAAVRALVDALRQDLTVQRFALVFKAAAAPTWLPIFRAHGLFASPPPVEEVEGVGLRASGWPALTYLRSVAHAQGAECAEIVRGIETNNWWVIAEALAAVVEIEDADVSVSILSLLRQWERSVVQWTQPETLTRVVDRLATRGRTAELIEALSRILSRFIADRRNNYDIEELIPELRTRLGGDLAPAVADAIENVLLFRVASSESLFYGRTLDEMGTGLDDGVELLVLEWLEAVAIEAKSGGAFAAASRAVRLAVTPNSLLHQMALRALSVSLSAEDVEPRALELLVAIAQRDTVTVTYDELPELLRLFGTHFTRLSNGQQASLLQRLVDQAQSDEQLAQIYARDWLHALRPYLSAREQVVLDDLASRLGPARDDFARFRAMGTFVGPVSPVSMEELRVMTVPDLLGIVRHVPVESAPEWPSSGVSPEGLGRLLQPIIKDRIDEFWPHLGSFAEATADASVLFYVIWGVRDAFSGSSAREPERVDAVLDFVSVALQRLKTQSLRTSDSEYGDQQAARGLADLLEALADWLVDSARHEELLPALEWLLSYSDPAGDDNWSDPPTQAINSVRGEAVLATLRMLSNFWGDEARSRDEFVSSLESLLTANVSSERSPAVLSCYGRYLPSIVTYWREFFDAHEQQLLPQEDTAIGVWASVFGTYLTFFAPHRGTARVLRPHYELAVSRVPVDADSYLAKRGERLAMHVIALALPRADDAAKWEPLLRELLRGGRHDVNARALHDLAFAIEREGVDVPYSWVLSLVGDRATDIATATARGETPSSDRGSREKEATALLELTFASNAPVQDAGGVIRSLVSLGGQPRISDVVEYLTACDAQFSFSGASVLLLALEQRSIDGYIARGVDALKSLLRGYGTSYPDLAWKAVELLGRSGAFEFEDVARELAAATA